MGNITTYDPDGPTKLEVAHALRTAAEWCRTSPAEERCYMRLAAAANSIFPVSPTSCYAVKWCAFGRVEKELNYVYLCKQLVSWGYHPGAISGAWDAEMPHVAADRMVAMAEALEAQIGTTEAPVVATAQTNVANLPMLVTWPSGEIGYYLTACEIVTKRRSAHAKLTAVSWIDEAELQPVLALA